MKKIIALFIALLMILCAVALPIAAFAEETTPLIQSPVSDVTDVPVTDIGDITTDASWLTTYLDYVIVGICIVIGLLVKHCTPLDNKYIPLIVAVVGLLVAVWSNWGEGITPIVLLGGLFSGLASTGFHQVFKPLFANK